MPMERSRGPVFVIPLLGGLERAEPGRARGDLAGVPARRPVRRVLSRGPPEGSGDGHPSGAAGCPAAHAADPRTPTARRCPGCPGRVLLLGLAPGRACLVSPCRRLPGGRLVSVALVLASRRAGVTRYPAPESPDVPHAAGYPATRDRPAVSLTPPSYRALSAGCGARARRRRPPRRPAAAPTTRRGPARGRGGSRRPAAAPAPRSRPAPPRRSGGPGAARRGSR
jgi:hypothetical protein